MLRHAEPPHVFRHIGPAVAQRRAVVDLVAGARAGALAGRRAGIIARKLPFGVGAAETGEGGPDKRLGVPPENSPAKA